METKHNLKYFTTHGLSLVTIIGLVLLIGGGILALIETLRTIGLIAAVVGLAVVIFGSSGKSTGDDIEYQATAKIKDMHERGMIRFELFEKSLKFLKPLMLRGYEFTDDVYYQKGSDGKARTTVFSAAILFFTGDKLHIHRKRFSFIDETIDEELGGSYKYIDLSHAEVHTNDVVYEVGKKSVKVKDYRFVLFAKDGSEVLNMSVEYGADIDKACEDIARVIEIRSQAYYDKVARLEAERQARRAADAEAKAKAAEAPAEA